MVRLTRRELLVGALALPAAGLSACRSGGAQAARLVVAPPTDPAALHPLLQTGLVEASVYGNLYDPLVALDADGRPQPALAESWQTPDDRTWVFRLRQGVTFHNGERFDAESVRFTVAQLLDPATGSPIRAQLDAVERVEAPDARTAVVVTRRPFAPLLAELTGLMMLPPGHAGRVGANGLAAQPVGTGPFRFVERVKDDRIVLEANRRYWRGAPRIDRLEFRSIPEAVVRWAAVQTGDVDLATSVPNEQVATLERRGVRVAARPGVQTLYLRLNARKPPLDDRRVRRAIVHAVNLDQVVKTAYGDRARRVNGPYPPEVFAYDRDAAPQAYDPGRARALLREAGVAETTVLTFEAPRDRYPKDSQVVQLIAAYLTEAGLRTRIQVLEWAAYLDKLQSGRGEHLFLLAGTNRTFDPHFTIVRLYANASVFGRAYYGNGEIDGLAEQAATALDPERRRVLYHQILGILRADAPALWIAQLDDLYALRPGVSWEPRADSLLWMHSASARAPVGVRT
ncbi:MAG TPA: ABC transporter substrate-binding protein [Chloroflexota bacterium]|nr:ABC transporter substrate-binding protein [Chloroflexota bacterium]